MTEATLAVVIPTIGRETLRDTLESIAAQRLIAGDQVIVVADGERPAVGEICVEYADRLAVSYFQTEPTGDWGGTQRNAGMAEATADYLAFMDDDDVYLPGAFDAIRRHAARWPGRPLMYRMLGDSGIVLWRERMAIIASRPELVERNVSTQMFVTPNLPGKLGTWTGRHEGDFDFMASTAALYPADAIVWRPELTSLLRHRWEAVRGMRCAPIYPASRRNEEMCTFRDEDTGRIDQVQFAVTGSTEHAKLVQWARNTPAIHDFYLEYHRCQIERFLWDHRPDMRGRILDVGVEFPRDWCGPDYWTLGLHDEDIQADIQNMPQVADASFDTIICTEVLEHIPEPAKAVAELRRVLRPGGVLLLTTPFFWCEHDCDRYPDYWRPTRQGLQWLLRNWQDVEVTGCQWTAEGRFAAELIRRYESQAWSPAFRATTGYLCRAVRP